jgi:hypothetical protein
MELLAQLKKISAVPALTKWNFGSVVDICGPRLLLPVVAAAPPPAKPNQNIIVGGGAAQPKQEEPERWLPQAGIAMEWKKMHDWFHSILRYANPLVELMTKEQFVNFRNEWFTKEIEFLGSSGAKGTTFQRSRNDIRAAFNNYQMQSARDEGYGGLKTHDENKIDSKESMILIRYVCYRAKVNCIWLEDDNTARPFPQDPRLWSCNEPIFFWDRKRRAMGIPVASDTSTWLSTWLSNWETANKKFLFPDADGKKADILEKWKQFTAYKSTDDKLKKEELAQKVGRAETISYFSSWPSLMEC